MTVKKMIGMRKKKKRWTVTWTVTKTYSLARVQSLHQENVNSYFVCITFIWCASCMSYVMQIADGGCSSLAEAVVYDDINS